VNKLRANVALQRGVGVKTELLSRAELRELAPYLDVEDVDLAAFEPDSGYASPLGTTRGFVEAATHRGAHALEGTEVTAILSGGGRVTGVQTQRGSILAPIVILAAGAWSLPLLRSLGLVLPLQPALTQVASFTWPPPLGDRPIVGVSDGILDFYFRGDRTGPDRLIVGLGAGFRKGLTDPDAWHGAGDASYGKVCLERLVVRMSLARGSQRIVGWSGPITLTPDGSAILDRHPHVEGLFVSAGDCGRGFKSAPVVGRALAEWAVLGGPRIVDLRPWRLNRFEDGQLLVGANEYANRGGDYARIAGDAATVA
jgi:sarcosine oxidase, subunit beta